MLGEKQPDEWFRQADYDMDTAESMVQTGRYIYAVFMCHLSIEKAFKGLFVDRLKDQPPKTHSLLYLMNRVQLALPEETSRFIARLNGVSIPTRYPDDIRRMSVQYDRIRTEQLLEQARRTLVWLKAQLSK